MSPIVLCVLLVTAQAPDAPLITLDEARQLARSQNLDVQIARERLLKASILSRKAWAVVLPTLNASASLARNNRDIVFDVGGIPPELEPLFQSAGIPIPQGQPLELQALWQSGAQIALSWTLLNGRSIPLIKNAYDTVEVAEYGYQQAEETLVYATTLSYYNTLSAERQVAIRKRALEIARANLDLAQARVEVGQSTEVDSLRADVEVAAAEQALVQAQNSATLAYRALATLLNRVQENGEVAAFRVERPAELPEPPADVLDAALDRRLDLKTRSLELVIAERSKTESWMKLLPVLSLDAFQRWTDVPGFSGDNTSWQVAFNLRWNIFEGGLTYWEINERQHDINAAALQIEKTRLDIAQEVAEARLNLDAALANHRAAQRRAALAQRSAELVRTQFEVGVATQLEVLDATRALADADAAEVLGQLAVDLAKVMLETVVLVPPTPGAANGEARTMGAGMGVDVAGPSAQPDMGGAGGARAGGATPAAAGGPPGL